MTPTSHPDAFTASRRRFMTGLAAAGAAAAVPASSSTAVAAAETKPFRIDVHHHLTPPPYAAELVRRKVSGQEPTIDWTPAKSLDDMDKGGTATAVTSITTPGVWFGNIQEARDMARICNDYAAKLRSDHPGRFGIFASVPLPDVDGALREIEYALDTLKADGIGVLTSFGDKWLGHPSFEPVWAELNRRKAVVYTHPTTANCCRNLLPEVNVAIIEFATDTTRAIADLVFSGTTAKFPDIKFIFSHAGGTMPFITERFTRLPLLDPSLNARLPHGVLYELQRFHYDVAQAAHPMALASLTKLVRVSQILFGTDFPYRTTLDHVKGLAGFGFSPADLQAIGRDNAVRLMPELRAG
jgi:predicted TIM-barrel fold metal-dependent hydrolase